MDTQEYLNELIAAARKAQEEFAEYPQEKVDEAVRAIGKAVYDHAEELAGLAVEETRMGKVDKQNRQVPEQVQEHLVADEGQEEPRHYRAG